MAASDDIKARLDIVDVVSEHVSLRKAGRNFQAHCPFHTERTPSFIVFPDRQTWRCFGACATGGDVFTFVMKKEGIGFGEALRLLAQRAGVTLAQRRRDEERDPLYQANEAAARFFQAVLASDRGVAARRYLGERGVSDEATQQFQLGLSPRSGDELKRHLLRGGHPEELLLDAGLLTHGEGATRRDLFRGRLMFPIRDERGRLVGFGGRALENVAPKYLNTPRTPIFDKGRTLYALDKAQDAIRREGVGVVVEGYTDAIAAHQHGFTNVVASMGTVLTERQVALLQGLTSSFVLALDPDAAGQEATLRSLESSWRVFERRAAARSQGGVTLYERGRQATLRIAALPQGQDPDQLIRAAPQEWRRLVEQATPLMDYLFDHMVRRWDLSTSQGKAEAAQGMFPLIVAMENPFEQDRYFRRLAEALDVSPAMLEASVGRPQGRRRTQKGSQGGAVVSPFAQARADPLEEHTLSLLLKDPWLREHAGELTEEHFQRLENRAVFTAWQQCSTIETVQSHLDDDLQEHFAHLLAKELPPADRRARQVDLVACLRRLEERRLRELLLAQVALEPEGEPLENLQRQIVETSEKLRRLFAQGIPKASPPVGSR